MLEERDWRRRGLGHPSNPAGKWDYRRRNDLYQFFSHGLMRIKRQKRLYDGLLNTLYRLYIFFFGGFTERAHNGT